MYITCAYELPDGHPLITLLLKETYSGWCTRRTHLTKNPRWRKKRGMGRTKPRRSFLFKCTLALLDDRQKIICRLGIIFSSTLIRGFGSCVWPQFIVSTNNLLLKTRYFAGQQVRLPLYLYYQENINSL